MKNAAVVLVLLAVFLAPVRPVHADAAAKLASLKSWFSHWKKALERSAVESRYRRGSRSTSVAAVRGAGQSAEDPKRPYWKGTWSAKKSAERMRQREELAKAVTLILEGKTEEGAKALDAFEQAHPKSSLLADVQEARGKLAELNPAAAAAVKPEETAAPAAEAQKSE